jgi:hypothetical protein
MRQELRDRLHKIVQQAAKQCEGRLPDHPNHPHGRIPIAHIYDVVQGIMGKPARECRDIRYDEILEIVQFCVDHAEEMSIIRQIKHKYQPEPKDLGPSSLEDFL